MSRNEQKIRIFSALEVANICGVVNQTAINWIRNGYLKAFTTPGGQYRVYAEDLIAFLDARGMRIPDELAADAARAGAEWKKLLIIDDDQDLNPLIKRMLEKRFPDLSILQAYDGFEAGRLITDQHPGFIVLDIDLPGINGHEICRRIKKEPDFGSPFVIAITGLDNPDEKADMLSDGADAFFAKPLPFEEFLAQIEDLRRKVDAE